MVFESILRAYWEHGGSTLKAFLEDFGAFLSQFGSILKTVLFDKHFGIVLREYLEYSQKQKICSRMVGRNF